MRVQSVHAQVFGIVEVPDSDDVRRPAIRLFHQNNDISTAAVIAAACWNFRTAPHQFGKHWASERTTKPELLDGTRQRRWLFRNDIDHVDNDTYGNAYDDLRVLEGIVIIAEHKPIVVFDATRAGNLLRVVHGESIGTVVGGEDQA